MEKVSKFLFIALLFVSGVAFSQTNGRFKSIASFNTDSTTVKSEIAGLQLMYDNVGALYYNKQSDKWRIFYDSAWHDLIGGGGGGIAAVKAGNGLQVLNSDSVYFFGGEILSDSITFKLNKSFNVKFDDVSPVNFTLTDSTLTVYVSENSYGDIAFIAGQSSHNILDIPGQSLHEFLTAFGGITFTGNSLGSNLIRTFDLQGLTIQSDTVYIKTRDNPNTGANSGDVIITTGDADNNSGNVYLGTGTANSGLQGGVYSQGTLQDNVNLNYLEPLDIVVGSSRILNPATDNGKGIVFRASSVYDMTINNYGRTGIYTYIIQDTSNVVNLIAGANVVLNGKTSTTFEGDTISIWCYKIDGGIAYYSCK